MTELNNIQDIRTIREIFKSIPSYLSTSYLGCKFLVFEITYRKAINLLLKNGFSLYPSYISKGEIAFYKKCISHPSVFMCRIGLDDFNILKEEGLRDLSKGEEELKQEIVLTQ